MPSNKFAALVTCPAQANRRVLPEAAPLKAGKEERGVRVLPGLVAGGKVSAWTSSQKVTRRSWTIWKAELNGADYLGAPRPRTALRQPRKEIAIYFSTGLRTAPLGVSAPALQTAPGGSSSRGRFSTRTADSSSSKISRIHPRCSRCQNLTPFDGRVIFQCTAGSHFVYPLIGGGYIHRSGIAGSYGHSV
ncbi:putative uncharacterized protein encoded by MIR7-3HG [Manis javanica]|nr:putative uncharacterized protein encoded by MIR7-3HG [Manis javanica]